MTLEEILSLLSKVRKRGAGYQACCPAHDDRNPSLSITEDDGRILLYCHAGCSIEEICEALDINLCDLFEDNDEY